MDNSGDVDENYQSLSDLLSGMVFIFIITLIAYIINFSGSREISETLGQKASDALLRKSFIIEKVSHSLTKQNIDHSADKMHGVIAISSDQLGFRPGSHLLDAGSLTILDKVTDAIGYEIICYTNLSVKELRNRGCAPDLRGQLSRVYIEGHTDNVPYKQRNSIRNNFDLSLMRASSIKQAMEENAPFSQLKKQSDMQELLIPAGFGASNPIINHDAPTSEPRNRRIEFRFVLHQDWSLTDD